MTCIQKEITISGKSCGFHSITKDMISQFPVEATYEVLDNISLDLEYVMCTDTGDANLRMALQVHF